MTNSHSKWMVMESYFFYYNFHFSSAAEVVKSISFDKKKKIEILRIVFSWTHWDKNNFWSKNGMMKNLFLDQFQFLCPKIWRFWILVPKIPTYDISILVPQLGIFCLNRGMKTKICILIIWHWIFPFFKVFSKVEYSQIEIKKRIHILDY